MGLPALKLSPSCDLELESILLANGIAVQKDVAASMDTTRTGVICIYHCSTENGSVVRIRVQDVHYPSSQDITRIAILEPASGSWLRIWGEHKLTKEVLRILREHGAMDFP